MQKNFGTKKKRRNDRGFLNFLGYCACFFLVAGGVGLYFAPRILSVSDAPQKADAIIVPGGSIVRAFHAARLYRDGFAPAIYVDRPVRTAGEEKIRISGVPWLPEEELSRMILVKHGVPEAAIRYYGPTISTAEEAEVLARIFPKSPCRFLVVTSPYHVRRVRIIFHHIVSHCMVSVIATPDEPFPDSWWRDPHAAKQILLESLKILYFELGGRNRSI
ncbi:MAG TPA: YdcF family protein [Dissulfurispiraceae bacterium]|nr:YdcF family protein [Dissulfurispiraceae bacterium]